MKLKGVLRCDSSYKGKSKHTFFNEIKPGDEIVVLYQVTNPGFGPSGGRYAGTLLLTKVEDVNMMIHLTLNFVNILKK
jgi:hypothetical protein